MKYSLLFFLLALFSCKERADTAKVIGIKDGDTIEVLWDGKSQTIRFADIDCPEKKQPFGMAAKKFTSSKCFNQFVKLVTDGKKDRYKRIIATVIVGDTLNLNLELVKQGLAWHFKKYSSKQNFADAELEARNNHLGLWVEENSIAPWDWRASK